MMNLSSTSRACLFVSLLMACVSNANDSDWHQWRGPHANGVSPKGNPPLKWSEEDNIKWKIAIDGDGTSTPIVAGNKVFVLTTVITGKKDSSIPDPQNQPKTNFFDIKRPNQEHAYIVLCLDRSTGNELWRRTVFSKVPREGTHNDNDFASASPVTDGKFLFAWFGSAGLVCLDYQGKKIWDRDLGEVRVESSLGEGCSPVLCNGKLIILRDNAGQSLIYALDSKTGKTIWVQKRNEKTAWATPLVVQRQSQTQVITAASKSIRSYDLDSGEVIWQCGGLTGNVIPCPVVLDGNVICMSGYQGYSALSIPLGLKGDITGSPEIGWTKSRGTPYIPSPLLYEDLLFYTQSNQPILTCVDGKTGEPIFGPKRIGQLSNLYASPVGAANRIYFVGRKGKTVVLQKSKEFKVLATNSLDDLFDASPAIAGGQIFLRGKRHLYCIESNNSD